MERREPVSLSRAVEVTLVPSGEKHVLPQGALVMPQQELGGHFTIMLDRGGLARLANEDADALGPAFAERARKVAEAEKSRLDEASGQPFDVEQVWDALKKVFDPEIPASIVDLGLVYELLHSDRPEGGRKVTIRMTLTAPGCGVAPMILDDVRERVAKVPGVGAVDVDLVFDPPWTPEKMSDAARLQLGFW
jgi:probable FeS assembly SUF system protein SufT